MNIDRAKRIYETWRRVKHSAIREFLFSKGEIHFCAILYHHSHDLVLDINTPLRTSEEVVHFELTNDGFVICEDQVVARITR